MPHRLVSVAILVLWTLATGALFTRDVLPDLLIGSPPDLRTIALADRAPGPTKWSILVAENSETTRLTSVGQVITETQRRRDGSVRMSSDAWLDSRALVSGTPLARPKSESRMPGERLEIRGFYDVDALGNLDTFRAIVRVGGLPQDSMTLTGRVEKNSLIVEARGPWPLANTTRSFPYQPRGMVQNSLGPMDWMPGLQVGQRWKSRMVSPLTGRVEEVTVDVARKRLVTWGSNEVVTLEVVTHMPPFSARTWVRPDGLVLRQEVPLGLVKLILERQTDDPDLSVKLRGRGQ